MTHEIHRRKSRAALDPAPQPTVEYLIPLWRQVLRTPGPLQLTAGASGEFLVAGIRLILALLLLFPLINADSAPAVREGLVGPIITTVAVVLALVMYLVARRDLYRPWIGAVSSAIDVSLVSGTLLLYLELGSPWRALNSRVVFDAYFLAIIASCLRYDLRISIGAGSLAVLQYAGILFAAPPGSFDWPAQAARLLLLAGATVLGAAVVLRTQALRQLSRSDRLTGLPNRSYFDERSQAELSRARRHGHAISLAMIDIDHFKRFNDTMGHAAGDIALKAVGATIQRQVRASDLVVRYGGEEFVAVFPGMNAHAAMERMELVRKEVAALALEIPRHNGPCGVTISAGIAGYGVDGVEVEDLLDCADGRLYQAKEAGRNRLVGPPTELLDAPPTWRTSGTMPGVAK